MRKAKKLVRIHQCKNVQNLNIKTMNYNFCCELYKSSVEFINRYLLLMFMLNSGAALALLNYDIEKYKIPIYCFAFASVLSCLTYALMHTKCIHVSNMIVKNKFIEPIDVYNKSTLRILLDVFIYVPCAISMYAIFVTIV